MTEIQPVVSLTKLPLDRWEHGSLFQSADISFGRISGLSKLGASYSEVPPGKSSCPFHNHHQEDEMFIVLEGEGTYRFGAQSHAFGQGDVLIAPANDQSTAHQIINTGSGTLRYIAVSTMAATEVCEYPDSGKFGVFSRTTGNPLDRSSLRHLIRDGKAVDYWDGEPGA